MAARDTADGQFGSALGPGRLTETGEGVGNAPPRPAETQESCAALPATEVAASPNDHQWTPQSLLEGVATVFRGALLEAHILLFCQSRGAAHWRARYILIFAAMSSTGSPVTSTKAFFTVPVNGNGAL